MLSNKATRLKIRLGFFSAILLTGFGFYGCGSDSSFSSSSTTLNVAAGSPIPVSVSAPPLIPVPVVPPVTAITIVAAAGAGRVTISSPNTLASGDIVVISGSTNYDGTYTVIAATPLSFTIAAAFVGPLVPSGTTPPLVQPQILATPVTGIAPSATPGQVILVANNTFTNGAPIVITGSSIPSLNGPTTVIAPTPSSFTITTTFVPPPLPPAGTPLPPGPTLGVILTGGGVLPGCTTTTTGTATAITLASLATVPSRFTGVAPLAVFFDATSTTATATTRPFHDIEYRWAFGETTGPGIGTWGTGSRAGVSSRNSATGPVAAHVFETPGTYIVNLTVTDGANTVSNSCVQLAVSDPDVLFAGANTICIGASSLPVAGAGSCPAGASVQQTADFAAAIKFATSGTRVLFRRGDVWTAPNGAGVPRLSANGPGIVGAFGAGVAPLVKPDSAPGTHTLLAIAGGVIPSITDWRIMDLEFDGLGTANSNGVVNAGGAQQMTFVRMNMHDIGKGIVFNAQGLNGACLALCPTTGPLGETVYDQLTFYNSDIRRMKAPSGGLAMFLQARRLALLGNFVDDTTAAEHAVRIQYASKGVLQANDLGLAPVDKQVLTIRAVNVGVDGVTSPGTTELLVISENLFRAGPSGAPVAIEPSAFTEDQRIRDIIFDGNLMISGPNTQTGLVSSVSEITVRNNIFNMTGGFAYNCTNFNLKGAEPAHSGIRVYNNTCFTTDTGGGGPTLRLVVLDPTNTNVTIKNNLGFAPNIITTPTLLLNTGSTGVTGASGTFGNSSNFQIQNTSPLFTNGSGTFLQASDYRLGVGSYAINTGVAVPVFSDSVGILRPQGLGIDSGATEQ